VADGLGAHGAGKLASTIAVRSIQKKFESFECGPSYPDDYLAAINEANEEIRANQNRATAFSSMRTTVVLLHIHEDKAVWLHCGDSRLYHIRNDELLSVTYDHSVAQMLVSEGEISRSEIITHPDRNRLTRSLGGRAGESKPRIVGKIQQIERGDRFLLCSDGYWENVLEAELVGSKHAIDCQRWVESILPSDIDMISDQSDNRTAVGVFVV